MYLHEIFQTAEPGDTVRRAVWAPHVFMTVGVDISGLPALMYTHTYAKSPPIGRSGLSVGDHVTYSNFGTADICATDWSIGGPEVEVAGNFRDAAALLMFGSTAVPLAVDPGGIGGYLAIPAYVPLPQPEGAE